MTKYIVSYKTTDVGERTDDDNEVHAFQAFPQSEEEKDALVERLRAGDTFAVKAIECL